MVDRLSKLLNLIGKRIRTLRIAKGYTQEGLSEKADLNISYIGQVERAERNISINTLEKIMEALAVSPNELFQFPSEMDNDKKLELIESLKVILTKRSSKEVELVYRMVNDMLNTYDIKKD